MLPTIAVGFSQLKAKWSMIPFPGFSHIFLFLIPFNQIPSIFLHELLNFFMKTHLMMMDLLVVNILSYFS